MMNVSAHRAFNLLKELAYEKVSCSEAETRAANRLLEEALACGVEAHIEEFSVPCGRVHKAKLTVTAPYVKEYEVTGYERAVSFDIPAVGADAQVVHSLAKWKRLALKRYHFTIGNGLYTDMNAIRRDEDLDNIQSI